MKDANEKELKGDKQVVRLVLGTKPALFDQMFWAEQKDGGQVCLFNVNNDPSDKLYKRSTMERPAAERNIAGDHCSLRSKSFTSLLSVATLRHAAVSSKLQASQLGS